MRTLNCFIATAMICQGSVAYAQEFPRRVEQPVIDPYGVEIKSGRFGDLSIPLISIGGDGDYALKRVYAPQDGRELLVQTIYDLNTSQQIFNNVSYDVIRYQHQNGSTKFRRPTGSSAAFQVEHVSKGFLLDGWFVDKYGVKYKDGKVVYPDGREVWGGVSSVGSTPSYDAVSVMRNNFGFLLKTHAGVTQAVNLARDYCDFAASAACTGLSATRTASFSGFGTLQYTLTNAAGEIVSVQFQSIEAFVQEPRCFQNPPGPYTCNGIVYPYNYPTQITFPGSSKPPVSISYGSSGDPRNVNHSEVLVATVVSEGVTVTYDNANYPSGTGGSGPSGYQVLVKAFVNGVRQFSSVSAALGRQWSPSTLDLKTVEDGLGRGKAFFYDQEGNVVEEVRPELGGMLYQYDARLNLVEVALNPKTGSAESTLITRFEYPAACSPETQATCNLPLAMIDPKGNRTEYTYNVHGQLLTKTGPAPTSGAARPITRNSYTMRTAYILNASANPVPAGSPISMLTATSVCITTENCVGSADEVVTTYDYGPATGPNNLLLRGVAVTARNAAGQVETLRTCYTYNYFGERISETKPRAGLGACS